MNEKEGFLSNPNEVVDGFNDSFVNVGFNLASRCKAPDGNPCGLIKGQFSPLLNLDPPNPQEVHSIIMALKNTAAGHDGIKCILIKETIDSILLPLTHILSLSLRFGIIPQDLKIAKVVPIFKAGDINEFGNYRPISILPCIPKILEKLVYLRTIKHLESNNILYKHQYGFRKKYSTEHALLQLVNHTSTALDEKKFAIGIFLDFSKAFDTVDHDILISKLSRYGVAGTALNWFKNYLTNREQFVHLNGLSSKKSKILFGVPQGSILGHLLFLIYINDMPMMCKKFLPILLADDTNLKATREDFSILIKCTNDELSSIAHWLNLNKLTLNVKKCNFMIFCNINKYYPKELAKILINGNEILQVHSTKFLGVVLDERLSWSKHIDLVSTRSMKLLGILRKVLPLIHHSAHSTLYFSFLFPHLNYCNIVWAATYPTYLKKLLLLQKRFLRLISHSTRYAPSAPLFVKYQLLSVDKMNTYLTCLFIHKFIYRKQDLPITFHKFFIPITDIHSHQTRLVYSYRLPEHQVISLTLPTKAPNSGLN